MCGILLCLVITHPIYVFFLSSDPYYLFQKHIVCILSRHHIIVNVNIKAVRVSKQLVRRFVYNVFIFCDYSPFRWPEDRANYVAQIRHELQNFWEKWCYDVLLRITWTWQYVAMVVNNNVQAWDKNVVLLLCIMHSVGILKHLAWS